MVPWVSFAVKEFSFNLNPAFGVTVIVMVSPASALAEENGVKGLANMILVGKLYKELGFCEDGTLEKAMLKCIPARKAAMIDFNKKAVAIGMAQ